MLTGKNEARTGTCEDMLSEADPHSEGRTDIDDLEFAINMLRVKLHTVANLSEKVRLYNQIKTLQDNIFRLKTEGQARS